MDHELSYYEDDGIRPDDYYRSQVRPEVAAYNKVLIETDLPVLNDPFLDDEQTPVYPNLLQVAFDKAVGEMIREDTQKLVDLVEVLQRHEFERQLESIVGYPRLRRFLGLTAVLAMCWLPWLPMVLW